MIWNFEKESKPYTVSNRHFTGAIRHPGIEDVQTNDEKNSLFFGEKPIELWRNATRHDDLMTYRRPRKTIDKTMCRLFLNNHGETMEGDCCPVPIVTVKVEGASSLGLRLVNTGASFTDLIGHDLHDATRRNENFNNVFFLRRITGKRRPRKKLTLGYARTFVARLGGRLA